jgi:hypothetical protein
MGYGTAAGAQDYIPGYQPTSSGEGDSGRGGIGTALSFNPVTAIGTAITGGISAYEAYQEQQEKQREFDQQMAMQQEGLTQNYSLGLANEQNNSRQIGMQGIQMMIANRNQALKEAQARGARDDFLNSNSGTGGADSAF